jgi:2-polyprenyl-6-methoxyphenol hydroxylase-like FAD-dependent oxidoreductase
MAPANQTDPPVGRKAGVLQRFGDFPAPVRDMIGASLEADILHTDIYDRDPVASWGSGRITLLGDAAHVTTPFMGQGAGIAMEDGVALAKELALIGRPMEAGDIAIALAAYEHKRISRTAAIVLASRRMGQMYQLEDPVRARARDLVMRVTPSRVWRRRLMESMGYEV